jgi:ankyrin repeat protein
MISSDRPYLGVRTRALPRLLPRHTALWETLILGTLLCACAPEETPGNLHDAAGLGDVAGVVALLDPDSALVGSRDADGWTPLHHAVNGGHLELAELLLDRGADVGARDAEERIPLHLASYMGNTDVVRLLLDRDSDVTAREFRGRTPLYMATNWGDDLEVVRLLVEAGSDVNDRTPTRGEEILFSTLFYGEPEIIDFLLESGARLPEDDRSISRAVDITASNGLERVFFMAVELAEQRGIDWWEEVSVHAAARGGSVAIAEALLAQGDRPDERNRYAAEHGRLAFVEFLVDQGASLEAATRMGLKALHFAQDNGHAEVADRLIAMGASPDARVFPELRGPYLGQPAPGDRPQVFAPGIVSGHGFDSEHSPAVFSLDGTEVYWTLKFRGPILHMKQVDGAWTAPEPVPFGSEHGDGEPIFTPGGQRLYFLSMRPLEPGAAPGKENIWYVERRGEGWSTPQPVSALVNDFEQHWLFSLSEDGTLYFRSVRAGGFGEGDIYRSRRVDGSHQEPENLGAVINTDGGEHTPFIAPDESYLIFVSTGHPPRDGAFHFFISYRASDGSWLPPISLDEEVGPIGGALCPSVTPDGRFMFFIGNGDIFWMDAEFIERLRPS